MHFWKLIPSISWKSSHIQTDHHIAREERICRLCQLGRQKLRHILFFTAPSSMRLEGGFVACSKSPNLSHPFSCTPINSAMHFISKRLCDFAITSYKFNYLRYSRLTSSSPLSSPLAPRPRGWSNPLATLWGTLGSWHLIEGTLGSTILPPMAP